MQEIQQMSSSLSSGHLQHHMDVILAKLPEGSKVGGHSRQRINAEVDILSGSAVTERTLVRLHQQAAFSDATGWCFAREQHQSSQQLAGCPWPCRNRSRKNYSARSEPD
ncbi:uncharacterized protein LOC125941756 [Dermacentor silvarum]|uniref:uncharacterized protein LOC125941756 n=1 Tax=Dermacentor silvarum TaxID=543639 RepID=UPI002100B457|nr:uncharacterized protein LOC125941756 [Dermacentor silvarum]